MTVAPTAPPRPAGPTLWEQGREPGRQVVSLGLAVVLTLACLDLWLTGHVSAFFDIGFVLLCAGLAVAVRPRDFFTVGVLPPLLMLATFALLGMSRSAALTDHDTGLFPAVVTGLAHHAWALALGYAAALAVLAVRRRVLARGDDYSNRSGSPAPRRTSSGAPEL